jgi:hypothetical protein
MPTRMPTRTGEKSQYAFSRARGARRTTVGWRQDKRRAMRADCNAAQLPPGSWPGLTREALARRRLLPLLGPPGHGGVGALQAPAGDRAG